MADTSIPDAPLIALLDSVDKANARAAEMGARAGFERQPVHTVYGGAHLFKADTSRALGAVALRTLRDYAPDGTALGEALHIDADLAARIYPRIVDKLSREPIEDYRIDFEDGFGPRSDEEEDRFAQSAAAEVARGAQDGTLPPAIGIRVKPLNEECKRRSLRTFDLFLTRLLDLTRGALPGGFVVTLPKIVAPEQVAALASACDAFEYWREIPAGSLKLEVMVETPQALVAADGSAALPHLIAAGRGRVVGAHFGPYDYTAACDITAAAQDLEHPACEFARQLMKVSLAGSGLRLSDGPTTIMPIGPHRGTELTAAERAENRAVIHRAWRLHAAHVRRALTTGFYQGWDLHPAQLPSRYAAVYAFFLDGLDAAAARLRNFINRAAQATRSGEVFDDAATGQGLLNVFLRAVGCGAIREDEAATLTGLTIEDLRGRSFLRMLQKRG